MESTNHLQTQYGNKRPFTVPDGYFSDLSTRVMEQLPAVEQKETTHPTTVQRTTFRYLRPLAAAAVTVGIVLVGFLSYHAFEGQQDESALAGHNGAKASTALSATSEDGFDQAADYFMIDESDMYAYMENDQ